MSVNHDAGPSGSTDNVGLPAEIKRLNEDIEDQNDRFSHASRDEFKHDEILKEVKAGIGDEQIDSFIDLLEKTKDIDYTDLAVQSLQAREELSREQKTDAELQREVELGISLAPRKAREISGIADEIRSNRLKKLEDDVMKAEEKVAEYGEAWVVPHAISSEDRMILYDLVNESNSDESHIIVDIIPLTPVERESQVAFVEGLKRQIKAPNATEIIVEYLKANPKKIIPREEIARLLYVADIEQKDIDHVTSRLGPKTKQTIINGELEGTGLKLQYGYRYEKDAQGKILRRTRIYRAIYPYETLPDRYETIGTNQGTTIYDEFKSLTADTSPIETIPSEDGQIIDEATEEKLDSVEKKEKDWTEQLREDTEEVIQRLIDDKLFDEDEMRNSAIRSLTSSKRLGPDEVNKLVVAGLMKNGEKKVGVMSREQRVIAMMFKKHPELESRKNGQQVALEIIRAVIVEKLPPEDK